MKRSHFGHQTVDKLLLYESKSTLCMLWMLSWWWVTRTWLWYRSAEKCCSTWTAAASGVWGVCCGVYGGWDWNKPGNAFYRSNSTPSSYLHNKWVNNKLKTSTFYVRKLHTNYNGKPSSGGACFLSSKLQLHSISFICGTILSTLEIHKVMSHTSILLKRNRRRYHTYFRKLSLTYQVCLWPQFLLLTKDEKLQKVTH